MNQEQGVRCQVLLTLTTPESSSNLYREFSFPVPPVVGDRINFLVGNDPFEVCVAERSFNVPGELWLKCDLSAWENTANPLAFIAQGWMLRADGWHPS